MLKFKRGLSVFLAIAMVMSIFAGVSTGFAPKASAATGTSNIKSYAELDAQHDGFIYLGLEAYETNSSGELILTDGYVQPGDRITYRFYVKSDRFIGNSIPYVTYDNTFFDVTRITDAASPQLIYNVYESQTKVDANPNHPMTSPKGLYGNLTSQPANTIPQIKNGYCGVDATVYNNWDIVQAAWNSDLTKANYPHIMTSDEWLIEWHATVKEGLAEGTKGVSQIVYDLYKIGTTKHPADVTSCAPTGDVTTVKMASCANMYTKRAEISAFLCEDGYQEFTIGENPADVPDVPAGDPVGTSNIKSYAELDAQHDGFIYLGLEAYETNSSGELILTDGYVQPGDRITYRFYVKSDRFIGNSIPYVTYDNTFFDVTRITDAENPQLIYNVYESQTKVDANPNHPMTSPKGLYGNLTSQPANTIPQIKNGYCGVDATVYNNWDIVQAAWNSDLTKANYPHIMTSDEWLIEWHATVKEGLAEGTKGVSQIVYGLYKIDTTRHPADVTSCAPTGDVTTVKMASCANMYTKRAEISAFLCEDGYQEFTIGNPPAGGTTYAATFKVDDAVVSTADYATGASIEAPVDDPVKAGYTFLGWALEGTTDVLTFPQTMGSAAVTYVAIFEQIATYTATFKVDGVVYGEVKSYQAGETIVAPADPTKTGYTFAGWDPTVGVMGEADIVFNATFTAKTYNVKFYTDETTEYTTLTVSYNGAYNLPSPPTKTGYSFAGWKTADGSDMPATHTTDADAAYYAAWTVGTFDAVFVVDGETYRTVPTVFGEAIVAPEAPTKTGYTFAGWSPEVGTMDAEGKTFTATWTAISVGVHFMDGDKELELKTGDYGTSITAINNPSKDGYNFAGWQYSDGSTATFPITLGTEDVYVYAQWTAKEYYIEFFGPGGAADWLSGGNQLCGDAIVAPDAPSKTGYNFTGWADAEGNPMPETVPPVENQKYFAQYEAITYTATFLADGAVHHTFDGIYKSSITAPATNPEKTGYTFSHWVKQGSTTKVTFPQSMPVGGVTYEAVFTVNNYNINYYVDGTLVKTESYAYGADVTPYAYTPAEGQSFSGWGDQVPATMPANDVNVYGTTGVNTYNVTFTVNGETYQVVPFAYGAAVTAPSYTVPEGHSFSGWNVPATMPANNITLDATLEKNTYNAIFYLDDAKTQVYATVPTVYGETIVFPENPSVDGKEFTGWDNAATVMGAGDMEFVAMFTDIEYFIEFLNEDGTAIEGYDWVAYWGDEITADQAPTVTKEGYAFAGWLVDGSKVTFPVVVNSDLTFTASFKINGYDITYMVDGVEYAVDTYQFGEAVTMRPAPEKEGYTFSGWDKTAPATMPAENIVISGTFTVNQYDALFYSEGVLIATVPTNYGEVPVAPEDPVKTGYNFVGWTPALAPMGIDGARYDAQFSAGSVAYTVNVYTMDLTGNYGDPVAKTLYGDADTEVTYTPDALEGFTVADNSVLSGTVAADGGLVLSVYYSRNQYTFKTVVDGVETPVTYYYGADVAAVEDPAKTGYTFNGWDKEIPATMPAMDVTVTAQWTINQYTITFAETGDSVIAPITQDYASAVKAPADPTKVGYTFAGWDKEIPATMPAENITITAKWTINQYTITFAETGDSVINPITQNYATDVVAPADPVKEGYTFKGWDKEVPATMPAENITITATWEVNYYDAIFVIDGAETKVSTAYGEIPVAPTPTKVGYTFTGWAEGEVVAMVVGGATYTAVFSANTYDAIFDANNGKWSDGATTKTVPTVFDTAIVAPAEEPTREGYIFAGWDPTVGSMTTEGITFKAVWNQNLDYCRVQNVERITANVYGPMRAHYAITVQGSPVKLQVVHNVDNGLTWTYDREDVRVAGDLVATGLVDIKAYNAANEEVAFNSPDTAYEKWTICTLLIEGEYKVRAKVDYTSASWESLDFAYDYVCAYDPAPERPDMVVSAAIDKATVTRGETAVITVVTDSTVNRLRFTKENIDGTMSIVSYAPTGSTAVTVTNNDDGTLTWAITMRFTYSATDLQQIQNWTVWYRAVDDIGWTQTDKALEVKVTRYAENPAPTPGYDAYSIISVSAPATGSKTAYTDLVIVTTSDVTKVRLNNNNGKTVTYLKTSNNVNAVDNGDGTMTWNIRYRFATVGEQTWGVQCRGNAWSAVEDATSFTITIA